MKNSKIRGIDRLKARYGYLFVSPWIVGFIFFFAMPLLQSFIYSFSKVTLKDGGFIIDLKGLANYKTIIAEDPNYLTYLKQSISSFLYSLPVILILSLVMALILNQKFRGRLFFRSLFFLPVIIASGYVMELLNTTTFGGGASTGVSDSITGNMFQVSDLINGLGLPAKIGDYFGTMINKIFDLIWSSGIQTILFISGLQSVPDSLYEVSKVEGATKWEEFWFVTFPSLSHVTLLVAIFTMIELFTAKTSPVIDFSYSLMKAGNYDESSAMLWFYFLIIGIIMGLIIWLYRRYLARRWE